MFPMETASAWRVEVPSPTGKPEVVVSLAVEDTTGGAAPLLELGAAAAASSLEDRLEVFQ